MARIASTLLVVTLLGGAAGAFAVTERLKLEPTPITRVRIDKAFSPLVREAQIGFGLRESDRADLAVVTEDGELVRTLYSGRRLAAGFHDESWDGRDAAGRIVPDGTYRPRLRLAEEGRTIEFPNEIVVDTNPPEITVLGVGRRVISPDGDRIAPGTTVRYRLGERRRALLLVNGKVAIRSHSRNPRGALHWYGRRAGKGLPAGRYRLAVAVEDDVGNRSVAPAAVVRIRYIELARSTLRAAAGGRIRVGVSTDARQYAWRLAGATGLARGRVLRLRAPGAGRYTLVVTANGHSDRARLLVRGRAGG